MAAKRTTGAEPKKFQTVRNRSGHRIELIVDGKVTVFLPGEDTKVPADFIVPQDLGLYVK